MSEEPLYVAWFKSQADVNCPKMGTLLLEPTHDFALKMGGVGVERLRVRCQAMMAHRSQPRLDYGLGFQVNVLETF